MQRKKILVVEDDRFLRQQMTIALSKEYEVFEAGDRPEGERLLLNEKPAVAVLDLHMPPSGKIQEGMKLLEEVRRNKLDTVAIVMSGDADMKATLKAMEAGAYDFFKKPFDLDEMKLIIRRALDKKAIERENERLRAELKKKYSFENIIGQSGVMHRVFDAIKRVSESSATVMIRGESGTGKELIARAIHYNSRRSAQPFVSVNCAALPETLIETELFGHERGAFTGAVSSHTGRFELADGGTLFLDEIGSISPGVQAKLLRVLEERRFERVGGTRQISSDVRLITATNEDLEKKVASDEFREDLYYRIKVFPIFVPPLRERREDIPLLLDHYLRVYCKENGVPLKTFSSNALEALMNYSWKGNVRELENLVQTVVLMSDHDSITAQELPTYLQADAPPESAAVSSNTTLDQAVERFEYGMIRSALQKANGIKTKAAELLGIDKNRMKYLCRKYKI